MTWQGRSSRNWQPLRPMPGCRCRWTWRTAVGPRRQSVSIAVRNRSRETWASPSSPACIAVPPIWRRLAPLGGHIRLCKGAYAEPPEVALQSKEAVDGNFALLMARLMAEEGCMPAIATARRAAGRDRADPRPGSGPTTSSSRCSTGSGNQLQRRLRGGGPAAPGVCPLRLAVVPLPHPQAGGASGQCVVLPASPVRRLSPTHGSSPSHRHEGTQMENT